MDAFDYAGSGVVFSRNVVRDNAGPGIVVISATGLADHAELLQLRTAA